MLFRSGGYCASGKLIAAIAPASVMTIDRTEANIGRSMKKWENISAPIVLVTWRRASLLVGSKLAEAGCRLRRVDGQARKLAPTLKSQPLRIVPSLHCILEMSR